MWVCGRTFQWWVGTFLLCWAAGEGWGLDRAWRHGDMMDWGLGRAWGPGLTQVGVWGAVGPSHARVLLPHESLPPHTHVCCCHMNPYLLTCTCAAAT